MAEYGPIYAPEASTNWYEGAGMLESVMGVIDGWQNADWLSVGANALSTGLSAIGAIMDPFQAIFAAGVGWLMEHVSFLREPLDWLAGDPKEIEGHAMVWRNIAGRVNLAAETYTGEVNSAAADWTTIAADAYRARGSRHVEDILSLSKISEGMARATLIAGAMVGVVRNTVRDVIAEVVGAAISKALQSLLVVTIPKVVAEVGILVAKCSAQILQLLKRLTTAISSLGSSIRGLSGILDNIATSLREGTNASVILGAYRAQAGMEQMARGPSSGLRDSWSAYQEAFKTISQGHAAAHGVTETVVKETIKSAAVNNGIQNSGATGDKLPDSPDPANVRLPL
ncbi:hypothetical protein [Winogradskya humida]|uniref:Uncharacterized protein n=1 Tax=Winogradskya humida TaxID=113566 RepID=A0ABQ3ZGG1_9ACTN|nr:hypothetical protein [Actinoplanes humidus]GIE17658.1 hypothetical protein Ahu01nite_007600 [Actinoplanes humidus]